MNVKVLAVHAAGTLIHVAFVQITALRDEKKRPTVNRRLPFETEKTHRRTESQSQPATTVPSHGNKPSRPSASNPCSHPLIPIRQRSAGPFRRSAGAFGRCKMLAGFDWRVGQATATAAVK